MRLCIPAARSARVMHRRLALEEKRAQGMPGAVAPESSRAAMREKKAHERSTGTTGQSGIPCAMLDDLFRALPGVPGFVATVPPGLFDPEVDTSVGVPGPHGFIGRVTRASSGRTHASIATRLTFRDDRP